MSISTVINEIEKIQKQFIDLENNVNERENHWNEGSLTKVEDIWKNNERDSLDRCCLDISNEKFFISMRTLQKDRNSLFHKHILTKKILPGGVTIYDRSPKFFSILLEFLRTDDINLELYDEKEIENILSEAEYFQIEKLKTHIKKYKEERKNNFGDYDYYIEEEIELPVKSVEISDLFEFFTTGQNSYTFPLKGEINVDVLKYDELNGYYGLAIEEPGSLIIDFGKIVEVNRIKCSGFMLPDINLISENDTEEFTSTWKVSNGIGSKIEASENKLRWLEIGLIPKFFEDHQITINFDTKACRYLRIKSDNKLGFKSLQFFHSSKKLQ